MQCKMLAQFVAPSVQERCPVSFVEEPELKQEGSIPLVVLFDEHS